MSNGILEKAPLLPEPAARAARVSDADRRAFAAILTEPVEFKAGDEFVMEQVSRPRLMIIECGWAASYKMLASGQRHVIDILLPGDMIGLRDLMLDSATHSAQALTALRARSAPTEALIRLMETNPRISGLIIWLLGNEEAAMVDNLVSLGHQTALQRTAWIIHRVWNRLRRMRLIDNGEFDFPVSQWLLADAIGVSPVHMNRTFRSLQEAGLVELKRRRLYILDRKRLGTFAEGGPGPH